MSTWNRIAAPDARRTWQGLAVLLILSMHGLGLYFLLLPPQQLKQVTEVAFMLLVPPRPLSRTPPMPLPMPMPSLQMPPRAGARLPPVTPGVPLPAPADAITPPAETGLAGEPALPAPADDLRTRARLAAGAADKALRAELKQDKPWLAGPEPQLQEQQQRFQKLVAAAYRGGPMITLEDYMTPDGRPATRVVTATGSKCYAMPANPGSGADPFNTGGKLKQVPC